MQIGLDRSGGAPPLPLQIAEALGHRIASGLLAPGALLPSIRNLARELGVSQVTAGKAYAELEREGWIERRHGIGCYVKQAAPGKERSGYAWQERLNDCLPRAQLWRNFDDREMRYPLHLAAIHESLLPLRELGGSVAKLVTGQPELMSAYGNFQGDYELRATMARHLRQRGIAAEPERVLVTSGAQQGIDLVARTFVGPGDVVYLEDPSYTGAIDLWAGRGARMAFVPTDRDGMRVDMLLRMCDERPPKLIYTVPTYQNPSGVTLGERRRRALLEVAQAYGALILEDDPFSDLYFGSPPPPPIKSLDTDGHVLYLKSFSKMLAPGFRLAALAADGDVLTRLIAAKSASDLGSPLLTQRALLPFIAGRYDAYAAGLRAALRRRMEKAARILSEIAPPGVGWTAPEGGLCLWLSLPRPLDTAALAADAAAAGVSFLPGSVCRTDEARSRHIRICYSILSEADTERALRLLLPLLARHLARA
ncbi:PLP-dependent aminotransferase family protein [Paenibacillus spiritus]|uniref:PLP-dependent aminotransferase family protein n=1 Tax=Paenibacillus spiritus TaxID=2496557 RepID=A0A5J5GIT2_9BACL|nr:PLP-dependent aminotransferase family protein [Paenibacillus spiritus]KAA9007633.1 PLP-dependent aminotransferase family protein [Paenibacillus spiritus]